MPSPALPRPSIATASTHPILCDRKLPPPPIVVGCRTVCRPLLCDLCRCRHRLAAIASVAAGLRFAMHNNQPKAEAAQWCMTRSISRILAMEAQVGTMSIPAR